MSVSTDQSQRGDDVLPEAAAQKSYDANGVDRSLVRWMLRQTPAQRLAYAQAVIDLAEGARRSNHGHR